MKSLFLAFLFALGIFALLRSELIPLRLVTAGELEEMKASAAQAASAAATAAAAAQARPTGAWMRDPKYRTSLDQGAPLSLVPDKIK